MGWSSGFYTTAQVVTPTNVSTTAPKTPNTRSGGNTTEPASTPLDPKRGRD